MSVGVCFQLPGHGVGDSGRSRYDRTIIPIAMLKFSFSKSGDGSPDPNHISTHAPMDPLPPPIALRPWLEPEE